MALFEKRCSLCGGRLDSNKRCIECGLDNKKNDSMYRGMMNRNNCDGEPLTHVHEELPRNPRQNQPKQYQAKQYQQRQYQSQSYSGTRNSTTNQKQTQAPKKHAKTFAIVIAVLGLLPSVFGIFGALIDENMYTSHKEEAVYTEYVDIYEDYLEPGMYTVGVHIPEGTYSIELGMGNYGTFDVWEKEDGILYTEDFYILDWGTDDSIEGLYLYEGEMIEISSGIGVYIYSEDADFSYYSDVNPLTDSYVLTGTAIAGEDFPAGVYDIWYESIEEGEMGGVYYQIYNENQEEMHMGYQGFSSDYGMDVYRNMPLAPGSSIVVENLSEITITPSEVIDPGLKWVYEQE